jgi:hypothetical protein
MSDTDQKPYQDPPLAEYVASAGYEAGSSEPKAAEPALPDDEPVTVTVEPITHGEAAQRAANRMHHSERTLNGGKA